MAEKVKTSKGELQGTVENGLQVFKGVPFARPPIGDLRFRAPQPMPPWNGVRDATRFAHRAMQVPNAALEAILGKPEDEPPIDEDCLYLNIWTPAADNKRRPVMVWIHGGGFTIGAGSDLIYDGGALAARDVVVVTINYRLGALGFLYVPGLADVPGDPCTNFGMLDQVAALRWVRDEIAAFGGDPDNVTIFGESAGGMSVGTLLASPMARGLFHKAILQSGAGHNALSVETAADNAKAFAETLGVAELSAEALRTMPANALLEAQAQREAQRAGAAGLGLPFQPVIDGLFLPELPIDAIREGSSKGVPVLIGTTADEYKLFSVMFPQLKEISEEGAAKRVAPLLPDRSVESAARIISAYREARAARGDSTVPYELLCAVITDWLFRVPADRLAEAKAAQGESAFAYRLDWCSPAGEGILGACHALDLPFVFGTHHLARRWIGRGEEVDSLASKVGDAWTAFARSRNPTTPSLPAWPAFDSTRRQTMILDRECRLDDLPREEERCAWEGIIS